MAVPSTRHRRPDRREPERQRRRGVERTGHRHWCGQCQHRHADRGRQHDGQQRRERSRNNGGLAGNGTINGSVNYTSQASSTVWRHGCRQSHGRQLERHAQQPAGDADPGRPEHLHRDDGHRGRHPGGSGAGRRQHGQQHRPVEQCGEQSLDQRRHAPVHRRRGEHGSRPHGGSQRRHAGRLGHRAR